MTITKENYSVKKAKFPDADSIAEILKQGRFYTNVILNPVGIQVINDASGECWPR